MNDTEKLIEHLKTLEESSLRLKEALLKKNIPAIWTCLAEQEKLVAIVKNDYPHSPAQAPRPEINTTIRELVSKIRQIQRTSSFLASTFLSVINRTMASLNTKAQANPLTYGATGTQNIGNAPIMVQQQG